METLEKFKKIEDFVNEEAGNDIIQLINVDEKRKKALFRYNQFDGDYSYSIDCSKLNINFEICEGFSQYAGRRRKVIGAFNKFESECWGKSGNAYVDFTIHLMKTPFRIIRQFIRKANKFGYELSILDKRMHMCEDWSVYVGFSKKGADEYSFIFRFSDHFLNNHNQVPAGVIRSYTDLNCCLRHLWKSVIFFESLTPKQIEGLWENRYYDDEFEYLNV